MNNSPLVNQLTDDSIRFVERSLKITNLQFNFQASFYDGIKIDLHTYYEPYGLYKFFTLSRTLTRLVFKSDIAMAWKQDGQAYIVRIKADEVYNIEIHKTRDASIFGGYEISREELELDREKILEILRREVHKIRASGGSCG